MKDIDFLEHGGASPSRPFAVRHEGEIISLPNPQEKHYQWVLLALAVEFVPGTPGNIPDWKRALVFDRWRAAWGLPLFSDARRLAYLVDNYRPAIAYDIAMNTPHDLGHLWRTRQWGLLLDVLDRLPAHSWYASSVSMDEEHAKLMAESMAAREAETGDESKPTGPALTTWTPEVAVMTSVLDAVRSVQHAVVAVQAPKGKQPEHPKPAPRPVTPLETALKRMKHERRKAAHAALVARVLPQKRESQGQVH